MATTTLLDKLLQLGRIRPTSGTRTTFTKDSTIQKYFDSGRASDPYADIELYDPAEADRLRRSDREGRSGVKDPR